MILDLKGLKNLHKGQLGTERAKIQRQEGGHRVGLVGNPSQHEGFRVGKNLKRSCFQVQEMW